LNFTERILAILNFPSYRKGAKGQGRIFLTKKGGTEKNPWGMIVKTRVIFFRSVM